MAVLFALVYPDQSTAEEASKTVKQLEGSGWITVLDESLVTKDEHGKVNHPSEGHPVRGKAVAGAVLGGLTGLFFAVPVAGLAAGAALGALVGKRGADDEDDYVKKFGDQVAADLQPGGAALLLLAESDARDRVIDSLGRLGGTVRSTDLSDQRLAEIQAEIDKLAGA